MIIASTFLLSLVILSSNPLMGLICLILSFPFQETTVARGVTVSTPIGLAFVSSWFFHNHKKFRIYWDNIYWLFIAFAFMLVLSILVHGAGHHATGRIIDLNLKSFLMVCVLAFLIPQIIDSISKIRLVVLTVNVSLLIGGVFNIYLMFFLGWEYRGDGFHRANFFFDPNFFSLLAVTFAPAILSLFFSEKRNIFSRFLILILAINLFMAFILSSSRGGLIAAITVSALFIYYRRNKYKPVILASLPILILGGYILINYLVGFSEQYDLTNFTMYKSATQLDHQIGRFAQLLDFENYRDFSFMHRVEAWVAGLRMLADHLFLGVGIGQFRVYSPEYAVGFSGVAISNMMAHNSYIEVFAELGVFGGMIFLSIMYLTVHNFKTAFKKSCFQIPWSDRNLIFALYIGSVGFMVGQFFVSAQINKYLWLLVGLSIAAKKIINRTYTSNHKT